jgi:hypothetical protein
VKLTAAGTGGRLRRPRIALCGVLVTVGNHRLALAPGAVKNATGELTDAQPNKGEDENPTSQSLHGIVVARPAVRCKVRLGSRSSVNWVTFFRLGTERTSCSVQARGSTGDQCPHPRHPPCRKCCGSDMVLT